jgi:hypothetical protein
VVGTDHLEVGAAGQNFPVELGAQYLASGDSDHTPRTPDHRGRGHAHHQIGKVFEQRSGANGHILL